VTGPGTPALASLDAVITDDGRRYRTQSSVIMEGGGVRLSRR
jgi:hypothetical protein